MLGFFEDDLEVFFFLSRGEIIYLEGGCKGSCRVYYGIVMVRIEMILW